MNARWWTGLALGALWMLPPAIAGAAGLDVQVSTDRGNDAVYQAGDRLEVSARPSADGYLMVYEIDSEGYVKLLYPYRGSSGFVEGHQDYRIPPANANVELVVDNSPAGQCFIVAILSRDQFKDYPWYLRPYDMQAEQVGYEGTHAQEEGVTDEGRIVGDPMVAMERIRRRVVANPSDPDAFATAYTSYYVHEQVSYPRYLCYDCHRPGHWDWWAGFDPYYTTCSVFEFRVNWGWYWGPGYWFGTIPYYCYVPRYNCPPYYRPYYDSHTWFSCWDGWGRWNSLWGNNLVRYKTAPPPGYVPPSRYPGRGDWGRASAPPPGFITANVVKGRDSFRPKMIVGRGYREARPEIRPSADGTRDGTPGRGGLNWVSGRRDAGRVPAREVPRSREEIQWTTPRDRSPGPGPSMRPREEAPPQEAPRGQSKGGTVSREGRRADPAPAAKPQDNGGGGNRGRGGYQPMPGGARAGGRVKG